MAQNFGDRKLWWIATKNILKLAGWLLCTVNQLG